MNILKINVICDYKNKLIRQEVKISIEKCKWLKIKRTVFFHPIGLDCKSSLIIVLKILHQSNVL